MLSYQRPMLSYRTKTIRQTVVDKKGLEYTSGMTQAEVLLKIVTEWVTPDLQPAGWPAGWRLAIMFRSFPGLTDGTGALICD